MIIGITGTLAAGKGIIVDFLKKKGFKHYSVRELLIKEIEKRNMPVNRDSMVFVGNALRIENSPSYIAEELYKMAKENGANAVIESLRTPGEIHSLKKKDEFYLFAVDADRRLRYDRAMLRANESDNVSFEKFVEQEETEMISEDPNKQNISKCIEIANYKFENNGSLEELHSQVERVLEEINSKEKIYKNEFNTEHLGRENYISWDEYFMGIALLSAQRSKDPSTQVGACIVDKDKKIVGTGYNGSPRGIEDKDFPWSRKGDFMNTKYAYVCHAELNAILNSTKESLKGCTMYVGLFPCNECAKAIIQSGIKKIVYISDKYSNVPAFMAARRLFEMAGIEMVKLDTEVDAIKLNFERV